MDRGGSVCLNSFRVFVKNFLALRFEPEAFALGKARVMGRQAAGDGFLRALAAKGDDLKLHGYGPDPKADEALRSILASLDAPAPGLCNDNFGVRLTTTEMAGFQVWFRNR